MLYYDDSSKPLVSSTIEEFVPHIRYMLHLPASYYESDISFLGAAASNSRLLFCEASFSTSPSGSPALTVMIFKCEWLGVSI
jgi:hypothetical protein